MVTGASTRWTFASSTRISMAFWHSHLTSLSLRTSHLRRLSIILADAPKNKCHPRPHETPDKGRTGGASPAQKNNSRACQGPSRRLSLPMFLKTTNGAKAGAARRSAMSPRATSIALAAKTTLPALLAPERAPWRCAWGECAQLLGASEASPRLPRALCTVRSPLEKKHNIKIGNNNNYC